MLEETAKISQQGIDWTVVIQSLFAFAGIAVTAFLAFAGTASFREWRKGKKDKADLDEKKTSPNKSKVWMRITNRAESLIISEVIDQFIIAEVTEETKDGKKLYLFNALPTPRANNNKPANYVRPQDEYTFIAFDKIGFRYLLDAEHELQVYETRSIKKCDLRTMKNNEQVKHFVVSVADTTVINENTFIYTFLIFDRFTMKNYTEREISKVRGLAGFAKRHLK